PCLHQSSAPVGNASWHCARDRASKKPNTAMAGGVAETRWPERVSSGGCDNPNHCGSYFLKAMFPNFELMRVRRTPRPSNCCEPPVQAGWVVGSISRLMVSPSLPKVDRVVN